MILPDSSKLFDVIVLVTWRQAKNGAFLDEITVPGREVVIEIKEINFLLQKGRKEGINTIKLEPPKSEP
jgi:hypothetical protein